MIWPAERIQSEKTKNPMTQIEISIATANVMMLIPRTEILPVFASGMLYPLMSVEDGIRPVLQNLRKLIEDKFRIDVEAIVRMFFDKMNSMAAGSRRRPPASQRWIVGLFVIRINDFLDGFFPAD
jgi:hypothetical protein